MAKVLLNIAIALNIGALVYCGIGAIQTAMLLNGVNDPPSSTTNKMAALAAIGGVLLASFLLLVWLRKVLGTPERNQ